MRRQSEYELIASSNDQQRQLGTYNAACASLRKSKCFQVKSVCSLYDICNSYKIANPK